MRPAFWGFLFTTSREIRTASSPLPRAMQMPESSRPTLAFSFSSAYAIWKAVYAAARSRTHLFAIPTPQSAAQLLGLNSMTRPDISRALCNCFARGTTQRSICQLVLNVRFLPGSKQLRKSRRDCYDLPGTALVSSRTATIYEYDEKDDQDT